MFTLAVLYTLYTPIYPVLPCILCILLYTCPVWWTHGDEEQLGMSSLYFVPVPPLTPDWFQLVQDQQQCQAYSTVSSKLQCPENIVIPWEGVLIVLMSVMISKHIQSGLEFTKLWRKIPTSVLGVTLIMFPRYNREHSDYTLCCTFYDQHFNM